MNNSSTSKQLNLSKIAFIFVLLAYLIYAGVYIYKTSFVDDGERYFLLFDDAMISMRYARNLVNGDGLVFNPGGERVEGFTNPLWVVFMAFFHLFPIPAAKISLAIQISGALLLALNLLVVQKIGEELSGNSWIALLGTALTAFYYPLNVWGLYGMEVSALVLLVGWAALLTLRAFRSGEFSVAPYLILGIGTFVRVDMVVPYVVVLAFLATTDPLHRSKHLRWGLGILAASLGMQTLLRFWYYGDLLPNTYHLKLAGIPLLVRVGHGLLVFFKFAWNFNWALFLGGFLIFLFRRDRFVTLLAALFLAQIAYSIYVGGDAWEDKGGANRYIATAIPMFFILFVLSFDRVKEALLQAIKGRQITQRALNLGLAAFVLGSMLNFNALLDTRSLTKWALRSQPLFVAGNIEYTHISLALQKFTTENASIAVVTAGVIPYLTDLYTVDLLGKNDAVIAHLPSRTATGLSLLADFRPGHSKWDYDYSIGQLQPDVIVQLWGDTEEARAYIDQYYTIVEIDGMTFSVRSDSPNILWDQVTVLP